MPKDATTKPHYVLLLPPIERESKPKTRDGNTVQADEPRVRKRNGKRDMHTSRARNRVSYGDESQRDNHLSSQQVFALVYTIFYEHIRHIAAGCLAGWLLCTRCTCDISFADLFLLLFRYLLRQSIFSSSVCGYLKKERKKLFKHCEHEVYIKCCAYKHHYHQGHYITRTNSARLLAIIMCFHFTVCFSTLKLEFSRV